MRRVQFPEHGDTVKVTGPDGERVDTYTIHLKHDGAPAGYFTVELVNADDGPSWHVPVTSDNDGAITYGVLVTPAFGDWWDGELP